MRNINIYQNNVDSVLYVIDQNNVNFTTLLIDIRDQKFHFLVKYFVQVRHFTKQLVDSS